MVHARSNRATRPFSIILVAGFQLFSAAYLLYLFQQSFRALAAIKGLSATLFFR
jgi:hypothetical protein